MRVQILSLALLVVLALVVTSPALANGKFKSRLTGFEEVPALSSPGSGEVEVQVTGNTIQYTLTYRNLDSGVLFAHIHVGQAGVNGGVSVFLCSNAPSPVPTPACPAIDGTVSGVLAADDVIGPAAQGIGPGELDELVRAIAAGATYANVHTNDFPSGEIRGQLGRGFGR